MTHLKVKDLRNLSREGYMRSKQWQLRVLGTISAFDLDTVKPRKTCAEE